MKRVMIMMQAIRKSIVFISHSSERTIKTKTIEFIGGVDTVLSVTTEYIGLGIGDDVKSWQIATKFDDIDGIEGIEILIAKSPVVPVAGTKIVIAANENARCDPANITVKVV